ncbi:MAG: sulfatase-like hydrolase/transferase, partial [Pseudomonadota bacterium]
MSRNVLWIMADQLRWDYLGCYGHPHLKTPHIDALAARGVRFNRAYVNSPICGSSRMCYYTGRYTRSHGATWNFFPLRIGEPTLGDHLKPLGVRNVLVGKTHMIADDDGMDWLGIDPASDIGVHHAQCGFEAFERDDGLHTSVYDANPDYDDYLRDHGFEGDNPWHDWANAHEGDDGEVLSGWLIKNNRAAARIPEEHSETAYMTRRAMEFMGSAGDQPWLCHLSYIKPHWPYVVPAPYHDMYPPETWLPVNRSEAERVDANPVYEAYFNSRICRAFSQDEVRNAMLGAYMGLIKQIDDNLGKLFAWMNETG